MIYPDLTDMCKPDNILSPCEEQGNSVIAYTKVISLGILQWQERILLMLTPSGKWLLPSLEAQNGQSNQEEIFVDLCNLFIKLGIIAKEKRPVKRLVCNNGYGQSICFVYVITVAEISRFEASQEFISRGWAIPELVKALTKNPAWLLEEFFEYSINVFMNASSRGDEYG